MIYPSNIEKFDLLRTLDLPLDQYAISGSGSMGIRHLREIKDIDLIVSDSLWNQLLMNYGLTEVNGIQKIVLAEGKVEAFKEDSFPFQNSSCSNFTHSVAYRIAHAEIIEGLPFDSLDTVLYYKKLQGRKKDLADVQLIENWLQRQLQNQSPSARTI